MVHEHIDCGWFERSLLDGNIRHWHAAAATESGFFRTNLDRRWQPLGEQRATLVSQARLLYVFACGYRLTKESRYLQAVVRGADFLLAHLRDHEHGGWFWSCEESGRVLDDHKSTYGHAFVIFGLSHAAIVSGQERFRQAALATWLMMQLKLRDEQGGFVPQTARDFSTAPPERSQNPLMHLFEALLALYDATGEQEIFQDATELAEFLFGRLYQEAGGFLPEMYDQAWQALPEQQGGRIDLGHQFEWAFLLSSAAERGLSRQYLEIGRQLLATGMRLGYDDHAGGIFNACSYDGLLHGSRKGWWQQAEHLRAVMHYAARRDQAELWKAFGQSLEFAKRHLMDFEFGGWYESYDVACPEATPTHKGSIWKSGYHVAGMHMEALRLCGRIQ